MRKTSRTYPLQAKRKSQFTLLCCLLFFFTWQFNATAQVVNSLADDNGAGTLRMIVQNAAPGATISFSVNGVITLTQGQIQIDKDLNIAGNGETQTVIDGNSSSRIFKILGGNIVTMSDLSIRNGRVDTQNPSDGGGGGIFNLANLTLTNVTVEACAATFFGGGISNSYSFFEATSPNTNTVLNCTNCSIRNNAALLGAGIYSYTLNNGSGTTELRLVNSLIENNYIDDISNVNGSDGLSIVNDSTGGGVLVASYTFFPNFLPQQLLVKNCEITNNTAEYGGGMAFLVSGGNSSTNMAEHLIVSSRIHNNTAGVYGGGIYYSPAFSGAGSGYYSANDIVNTEVSNNTGGGIHLESPGGSFNLTNTTVAGNLGSTNAGGVTINFGNLAELDGSYTNLNFDNNIISLNTGVTPNFVLAGATPAIFNLNNNLSDDYNGLGISPNGTNIEADPMFVNNNGDYHLTTLSPAIDAGANNLLPNDVADVDGDNDTGEVLPLDLFGDERRFNNGVVDMGACELQATACLDSDGDGICDDEDNCVGLANPSQLDTDQDGQGDVCDADDDNDGVLDVNDSDPLNAFVCQDLDGDG
ncbi:MAG: hypothetical protein AB8G15_23110 [Saprospiraceae bacterium]